MGRNAGDRSETTEKVYFGKRVCINTHAPSLRMDNINCLSITSRGTAPIRIRARKQGDVLFVPFSNKEKGTKRTSPCFLC